MTKALLIGYTGQAIPLKLPSPLAYTNQAGSTWIPSVGQKITILLQVSQLSGTNQIGHSLYPREKLQERRTRHGKKGPLT
jgi:hypothetical protein